jgi:hypothetical protein
MPAIIRQQYIDPISGRTEVAEMEIDIEMVQKDDLESVSSELLLRINPWGHPGQPFRKDFKTVYVDPSELISSALDSRRNTNTKGCKRTKLLNIAHQGLKQIVIENPEFLNAKAGDAIVILSDLNGNNKTFALIEGISGNTIQINCGASGLPITYYKGAIVENLADRWHKDTKILGAKSQLKRPQPMPIYVKQAKNKDGIQIIMQAPISMGILKACDVYIRKEPFETIESHWIPDKSDVDINEDGVVVHTFGGGQDAGGGNIDKGNYYIGLTTKDNFGFYNVNESEPSISHINLN